MPNTVLESKSLVHVAVAVIERGGETEPEVLVAKRPEHVHQGGLWEFPGGKVESGETVLDALDRELHEELGIRLAPASPPSPLISIRHDYGDKCVWLDVWRVAAFSGEPTGKEGQPVRWVAVSELGSYDFPAANASIVTACQLPPCYVFTPAYADLHIARENLGALRQQGHALIRLRQPELSDREYAQWLDILLQNFQDSSGWLVVDRLVNARYFSRLRAVHLGQTRFAQLKGQSFNKELPLAVSCHNLHELLDAVNNDASFVTLSPVALTASHPGQEPLGWPRFRSLVEQCNVPVYALGGVGPEHLEQAQGAGAQGVSAIRSFQMGLPKMCNKTNGDL